ncbi:MAG: GntR family transcriptional regulator [Oscillospiraceae bacterium]|nr:GntR family transcriptional regulator [Oscillospiraceae bacterium]
MTERRNISIADQIFDQLEKDILSGRYARGEVLSELRLSKEMGVSRTPIREALLRLEQENLVQETGRGMTVIGISPEDMMDLYDIRLRLEGEAARRAAVNMSDRQLAKMLDLIELQEYYINRKNTNSSEETKNLDSQIHGLIYECCGSKAYQDVLGRIHKKMTKFRKASIRRQSSAQQSNDEHMAIYRALLARSPEAAEKAMLEHVRNARQRMEVALKTEE